MTTVFLSGSRKISRLHPRVSARIDNMIASGFSILTGDANGADKAMQRYLADNNYQDVTIYYVGAEPRNNVGNWSAVNVASSYGMSGRDFYAQKDQAMAKVADYGLVLWDGKSPGSVQNMLWLLSEEKKSLVFLNSKQEFHKIACSEDLSALFLNVDRHDIREIDRKINLPKFLMGNLEQSTLQF